MIANNGSIRTMRPGSGFAFAFRRRPYWSQWWLEQWYYSSVFLLDPGPQPAWEGGRRVFWEGLKFFALCPTDLNYVQNIFPGGAKNFLEGGNPPYASPGGGPD